MPCVASGADPDAPPIPEAELAAVTIGDLAPLDGPIVLAPPDPAWADADEREAAVRAVLGERVRLLEHVGSEHRPF